MKHEVNDLDQIHTHTLTHTLNSIINVILISSCHFKISALCSTFEGFISFLYVHIPSPMQVTRKTLYINFKDGILNL